MAHHAAWQASFARRGYLAATIDCRYHGERVNPALPYQEALVRAWHGNKNPFQESSPSSAGAAATNEYPFLLDNVWDLIVLLDFLCSRKDVDPQRIGVTGFSLGGMHSYILAAADVRIAAAAPAAGFQWFMHAIESRQFMARVESIPAVFYAAAKALRSREDGAPIRKITSEVVTEVWNCLLPGMLQWYDAPVLLATTAPRSLLVVSGENDPRCPADGVRMAVKEGRKVYAALGAETELELFIEPGIGHDLSSKMVKVIDAWMDSKLLLCRSNNKTLKE